MDTKTRIKILEKKVFRYESLLHLINIQMTAMNHENIKRLLKNIDSWSYAHRVGNGEHSDEEQAEIVQRAFNRLTNLGE